MTYNGSLALAGVLYGGVQEFQVRENIITTTQILSFCGKGEILMLGQKKKIEFLENKV